MPEKQSDLRERLSSWKEVAERARDQQVRQQRPLAQTNEAPMLRLAVIVIWLAGLAACGILSWHLSNGSVVLTAVPLLIVSGAWKFLGLAWWGLLLPLSLIGLLAIQGAATL